MNKALPRLLAISKVMDELADIQSYWQSGGRSIGAQIGELDWLSDLHYLLHDYVSCA